MKVILADGGKSIPQAPVLCPSFPWIIFDMDGTLVNSFGLILASFNYAARRFLKRELPLEEVMSISGRTLEDQLANYVPQDAIARSVELYHRFFARHFTSEILVYPGVKTLLFTLQRRGVKLAVFTGACRRSTDLTLNQTRLHRFFEVTVTGDDISRPKPDPEGLRTIINSMEAHPKQTIYVGDHPNDLKASRKAGIGAAAAFWGSRTCSELKRLNPDFAFRLPSDALCLSSFTLSTHSLIQPSTEVGESFVPTMSVREIMRSQHPKSPISQHL